MSTRGSSMRSRSLLPLRSFASSHTLLEGMVLADWRSAVARPSQGVGIVLLLVALLLDLANTLRRVRGVLFGVGAALVLDEFALILNLSREFPSKRGNCDREVAAHVLTI